MNGDKLKHLEFIQNNIIRMSTNSFIIKGWTITLFSALFVFAQKKSNKDFVLVTYFAIPLFWYLNGFFLLQERKFRELYDNVRLKQDNNIDFSMDTSIYNKGKCNLTSSIFSKSIWPLYTFMILITVMIMFLIK